MLVLTRKIGEEIIIGDNIRITVVEVGPGRVKIGIAAPRDVRIDRDEVRVKKEAEVAPLAPTLHNRMAGITPRPAPSAPVADPILAGPVGDTALCAPVQLENRVKALRARMARKPK